MISTSLRFTNFFFFHTKAELIPETSTVPPGQELAGTRPVDSLYFI